MPKGKPMLRALAAVACLLALGGCGGGFGWHVVDPTTPAGWSNLTFILEGFRATIEVAVSAMALSILLGLVVALAGAAPLRPVRILARVWVEGFRSVPILVMILWAFYGLPIVSGIRLGVFAAAVLAIALCDSAFEAEIFRAGIQSVEAGQREAALALGLSRWQSMRLVVLPQAVRRILPALGNQFVYVVKMSSLASVIGLPELTRKANELVVTVFRPLEIYTVLILCYLVLVLAISAGVRWLERRLAVSGRAAARTEPG
jgi:His/Glu/Gln/Arg/opine family amino acid ABC transporter permease subunit